MWKKYLGVYPLRKWDTFLDLKSFKLPTPETWLKRLKMNLDYFAANYLAVAGVLFSMVIYARPRILLVFLVQTIVLGLTYDFDSVPRYATTAEQ